MELATSADMVTQNATTVPYVAAYEKHTGVVVLAGDRALKVKKPVQTDFLDFHIAEQRERACVREVELNSRLATDSYFGVAHLTDLTGAPPEPVIVMRRYHDDDRLASMVKHGHPDNVAAVYEAMLQRTRLCLGNGHSVILDGTWRDPQIRAQGQDLATEKHAAIMGIMCVAPVHIAADRIRSRPAGNSDTTAQIAAALAAQDLGCDSAHRIDTPEPPDHSVRVAEKLWRAAAPTHGHDNTYLSFRSPRLMSV